MNWFMKLFDGKIPFQNKCTCGQQEICSVEKYIQGPGIIGVESNTLLNCGKVKQQMDILKESENGI